jgi:hypothetical protein
MYMVRGTGSREPLPRFCGEPSMTLLSAAWLKYSEDPSLRVLDMNTMYHSALTSLEAWSTNAESMIECNNRTIFSTLTVNDDQVMTRLLETMGPDDDQKTIILLQQLC